MDPVVRSELVEALRRIVRDEGGSGKHLEARASAARQLAELLSEESEEISGPDAPMLNVGERETLRYLMYWGWDANLWDRDCRKLLIKLGVYSPEEVEREMKLVQPRRTRRNV